MEEGSVSPARTMTEPSGKNRSSAEVDRDQARVELRFVMDERDRISKEARMAAADRDRLADLLRSVEAERDVARDGRAAALAEQQRLLMEMERLRADLDAARQVIARAEDEIRWLRAMTGRLAAGDRCSDGEG